jgi:hypothetical protein
VTQIDVAKNHSVIKKQTKWKTLHTGESNKNMNKGFRTRTASVPRSGKDFRNSDGGEGKGCLGDCFGSACTAFLSAIRSSTCWHLCFFKLLAVNSPVSESESDA